MRTSFVLLVALTCVAGAACGSSGGGSTDAGVMGDGSGEARLPDGAGDGTPGDGTGLPDADGPDGDTGGEDALGPPDGQADPGTPDPGLPDPGTPDPGLPDPGKPEDAGPPDAKPDEPQVPDVPPPADTDGDGVPDAWDPYPNDPQMPGVAEQSWVYMHTSDALYRMDVKMYKVMLVGEFKWEGFWATDQMTDLAIDRWGVLYGISFSTLYVCHPQTAACKSLGELPSEFNGLTVIPVGVLEPDDEVLVGISSDGGWYRLDVVGTQVQSSLLGSYGSGWGSSGDAYSIVGVGTFASVHESSYGDDTIVEVDPATGKVLSVVAELAGYGGVFGLAGWTDRAFAFDESGTILIVNTTTGGIESTLKNTDMAWWGAGVRTEIP